ncbi:unnamed protein product, partial [Dovyalis caffra]
MERARESVLGRRGVCGRAWLAYRGVPMSGGPIANVGGCSLAWGPPNAMEGHCWYG